MTTTATKEPRQAREARLKANQYRLAAAHFKREVFDYPMREGLAVVADLLENPELPIELGHIKLATLVAVPQRMGRERAGRILRRAGINPARDEARLDHLTEGERRRVASAARERADRIES